MKAELTNLDKIYFPKEKITKGDILQYYKKIAPYILPYLKNRPESLRRYPNGIAGETFFQKNLTSHPDWVPTVKLKHESKTINYLLIQDLDSLLYAVNLGCIELHPFFSTIKSLHNPDFFVLDLDPKNAPFADVIETAQAVHETMEELGIPSYCKTSGATGLHIYVPLKAKYDYDEVVQFAEILAILVNRKVPDITTLERPLKKRTGKVYIDYLQNHLGQTLAAPYCVRAKPGATVSTPLHWKEVKKGLDPKDFNIKNILKRLDKQGDIFKPILGKGIDLKKIVKKLNA